MIDKQYKRNTTIQQQMSIQAEERMNKLGLPLYKTKNEASNELTQIRRAPLL